MTMAKHRPQKGRRHTNPLQLDFLGSLDTALNGDLQLIQVPNVAPPGAGALDDDQRVRRLLSDSIRRSPHDRDAIARHMADLTGRAISRAMLDAWTGPSRENRFGLRDLRAFASAVGCDAGPLFSGLLEGTGCTVLTQQEAEWARIGQLCLLSRLADAEIARTVAAAPRFGVR